MNDLAIRAATTADAPALLALSQRMANFDLPPWRTPAEITEADGSAMVTALSGGDPDSEVFIAERHGAVAGCLHLVVTADFFGRAHAHISVIATSEAAEGSGVGRALIAFADNWARQRRLPIITLNVFATNARARRLYEQAGFEVELLKYAKQL